MTLITNRLIIFTMILNCTFSILGQEEKDKLSSLLVIPECKIQANGKLTVKPEFANDPMYNKIPGRTSIDIKITSVYFTQAVIYKLSTGAGQVVLCNDRETNKTEYWFKGTNELFGSYKDTNVSGMAMPFSPYIIRDYLKNLLSSTNVKVEMAPGNSGFIVTEIVKKEGIPGVYNAKWAIATDDSRISKIDLIGNLYDDDNNLVSSSPVYTYSFSNFSQQFPTLPQSIQYVDYGLLGSPNAGKVAQTLDINLGFIQEPEKNSTVQQELSILTQNMFKHQGEEGQTYRLKNPPTRFSNKVWWIACISMACILLAVIFSIRQKRR